MLLDTYGSEMGLLALTTENYNSAFIRKVLLETIC